MRPGLSEASSNGHPKGSLLEGVAPSTPLARWGYQKRSSVVVRGPSPGVDGAAPSTRTQSPYCG